MQSNLSQLQRHQITLITRVTPYAMAGHLLNTTVLDDRSRGVDPANSADRLVYLFLLDRFVSSLSTSKKSRTITAQLPTSSQEGNDLFVLSRPAVEQLGSSCTWGRSHMMRNSYWLP